MSSQLTLIHAEEHIADLHRAAKRARVTGGPIDRAPKSRPRSTAAAEKPPVTIRPATSADLASLREVARLDSQRPPRGELLVAEIGDEIVAALVIGTQVVVANPFRRTADAVALLRLRSEQLTAPEHGSRDSKNLAAPRLAGAADIPVRTR